MKFPAQKLSKGMEHLRIRAPFVLLMGGAALFSGLSEPSPPPKSSEGVAEMLGRSVSAKVAPDDFVWEQRGGFWKDAFWGRSILFLASKPGREGEPAESDLYRAKVRLTRAGRPISIHSIKNLSKTPLGQERDLKGLGNYIAFTTLAFDSVQGISILDLSGDYGDREAKSRWQSFKTSLENFVETGSFSGLGRIELAFGNAPAQLYSELSENTLWITPDNPSEKPRVISLDLKDLGLKGEAQKALDARVQRIPHPLRPFSPTLLALSEMALGERAGAYIQAWLFSLDASEGNRSKGEKALKKRALWPLSPPSEAFEPAISEWGWPPASITLPIASDIKGEGLWMASASALLPERKAIELRKPALELQTPEPPASDPNALDAGVDAEMDAGGEIDASLPSTPIELPAPAPLFYQSQYRPDPAHPESRVLAIAMDMRQLELHIEAGYDEPRPVTGPRGSGRLPRGALASRVAAAFIGGKPKGLPELGMVVKGRILVPPTPNAPSILIERRGHAFVGPWLFENALPPGTLSMRQSPLWLLQNGARPANPLFDPDNSIEFNSKELKNPSAPQKELKTIKAADFLERSALCLNKDGHFIYFFAPEIDEQGLSKAAYLAGCQHALHLGAPPTRAGFAFVRADPGGQDYEAELISPLMSASPDSFTQASANEIWYLLRRQNNPSVLAPEGGEWEPETGKNSIPPWLPAVYTANTKNLGAEIKVYYLAPERFAFRLLAGSRERAPQKGTRYQTALPEGENERAALVFGLGVGRRKGGSARGLATLGSIGLPIRKNAALLLTGNQGLLILRSEELPQSFEGDATELAMTADEGKILPEGRKVGMRRERACICVLEDGAVLIAHTIFDSDEASTEVLLKAGCQRVAGLDRGSQGAAFIERISPSNPLKKRYEASILVAVDLEMKGRAQPLQ